MLGAEDVTGRQNRGWWWGGAASPEPHLEDGKSASASVAQSNRSRITSPEDSASTSKYLREGDEMVGGQSAWPDGTRCVSPPPGHMKPPRQRGCTESRVPRREGEVRDRVRAREEAGGLTGAQP